MIEMSDIAKLEEIPLYTLRYKDGDILKEAALIFYLMPRCDDAWYEIEIGQCNLDNYVVLEAHKFNSSKKAIKWWNDNLGDKDGEVL